MKIIPYLEYIFRSQCPYKNLLENKFSQAQKPYLKMRKLSKNHGIYWGMIFWHILPRTRNGLGITVVAKCFVTLEAYLFQAVNTVLLIEIFSLNLRGLKS